MLQHKITFRLFLSSSMIFLYFLNHRHKIRKQRTVTTSLQPNAGSSFSPNYFAKYRGKPFIAPKLEIDTIDPHPKVKSPLKSLQRAKPFPG
jgi:hypothetical protein